jgi:hypothetical protein
VHECGSAGAAFFFAISQDDDAEVVGKRPEVYASGMTCC